MLDVLTISSCHISHNLDGFDSNGYRIKWLLLVNLTDGAGVVFLDKSVFKESPKKFKYKLFCRLLLLQCHQNKQVSSHLSFSAKHPVA